MLKQDRKGKDITFIIHGVGSNKHVGMAFQNQLEDAGMEVHNETYQTRGVTWQEAGKRLAKKVEDLGEEYTRVHFIGHSLGCVVIMKALEIGFSKYLGRVVLMAGPLKGATWVNDVPFGRKLGHAMFGKVMVDSLMDLPEFDKLPDLAMYNVLCITTDKKFTAWNPLSWIVGPCIEGDSDGFVPTAGMSIPGREVANFKADHLGMMWHKPLVKCAVDYVLEGA